LNGGADPGAFAELARRAGADVVAVQELGHEQAEALSAVYPHGRLEPDTNHRGGGIALARPAEVARLPLHGRDGFRVELAPGAWPQLAAALEIVSVHVFAPHAGLGLLRRWPQLADLERHLRAAPGRPRVVVGDFNATPLWPVYWRMRRWMEDAAVRVARRAGERPRRTWGPGPGSRRLLRIDHGFVAGVETEAFRVLEVPGSDHSAIVLDVSVREASQAALGEQRFR
jgi:endonuclease/exonuclease/phosphatase family metal-dependent hydrolase